VRRSGGRRTDPSPGCSDLRSNDGGAGAVLTARSGTARIEGGSTHARSDAHRPSCGRPPAVGWNPYGRTGSVVPRGLLRTGSVRLSGAADSNPRALQVRLGFGPRSMARDRPPRYDPRPTRWVLVLPGRRTRHESPAGARTLPRRPGETPLDPLRRAERYPCCDPVPVGVDRTTRVRPASQRVRNSRPHDASSRHVAIVPARG
jgi:hypothetical protein